MARLSKYQKRKRAGKRERVRFEKYRVHYLHLATMFSGFALCGGFLLVMGFVRGYDTTLEIVVAYSLTAFTGLMLSAREYFVIKSSWRWWKLMMN